MRNLKLKKAVPIILSVLGVIGVGVTAVLSSKDTAKSMIERKTPIKEELVKTDSFKEKANIVAHKAKDYAPTIASATLTCGCIIGSMVLSKKFELSLIAAYTALENSYKKYKDTNIKMNGTENDKKIKAKMAEDVFKEQQFMSEPDKHQLFYDEFAGDYFEGDIEQVVRAEYCINKSLIKTGYATLNQFYRFMGKKEVYFGNDIGWSIKSGIKNHYNWIGIEHDKAVIDGDLECIIISLSNPPTPDFL